VTTGGGMPQPYHDPWGERKGKAIPVSGRADTSDQASLSHGIRKVAATSGRELSRRIWWRAIFLEFVGCARDVSVLR